MVIFPNAKINIGLNIISRRSDGYHNIESLFYPVGAMDALEFVKQQEAGDKDILTVSGLQTGCTADDNLVIKALALIREDYNIPALKIHLHKIIPAGSGLGGGSSDAAFLLKYLNRYFKLDIKLSRLSEMALQIGSDCAFFIKNEPAIVSGRGEILKDTTFSLEGKYILLVHPGIHVSTAEAYSLAEPRDSGPGISELIHKPLSSWKNIIRNDFQDIIINRHPLIGRIIDDMYEDGALYCSMSGSGSAVYGIFKTEPGSKKYGDYWKWSGPL